jgi:hypothetical protein
MILSDTFDSAMRYADDERLEAVGIAKMHREIRRLGSAFPAYAYREQILDSVRQSKVSIIIGRGSDWCPMSAPECTDEPGSSVILPWCLNVHL